jgi:hypothetical protein
MPTGIDKVRAIVNGLHKGFFEKYGYTVFDITADEEPEKNEITITGACLTKKQLTFLKKNLDKIEVPGKIKYSVNVLSDVESRTERELKRVSRGIVDVTSDYYGTKLSTQITPDDTFEIILRNSGKELILLNDSTLGWIDRSGGMLIDDVPDDIRTRTIAKGEIVSVNSVEPILDEADKFINKVKYLHGGKSGDGIDCSALVQVVFKRAYGLTLPRHTLDQMKCGARVTRESLRSGDLIFAKRSGTKIMHVGIVYISDRKRVIHSCLREKLVISEEIKSFFEHYSFAGARRIIKEKE